MFKEGVYVTRITRFRTLVALFLLLSLSFSVVLNGRGAAQEATPAAGAEGPANPEPAAASPTPELPTVPPETEQYASDWPVPQGNLASTRSATGSTIDSSNVNQLDVAWTFDVKAAGFFGSVTANPIVVGDTVYLQDMQSNIFALDRNSGAVKWQTDFNVGSIGPNGVAVGYGLVYAGLSDTGEVV